MNMCVIDGIKYAINKTEQHLLNELSKNPQDDSVYLDKSKMYRSEENIFEKYTDDDREKYFGKVPKTVYENICSLSKDKYHILLENNVFTEDIINSFKLSSLDRYLMELEHRILPSYKKDINLILNNLKSDTKLSSLTYLLAKEIKFKLFSDTFEFLSLNSKMKTYIKNKDFENISKLQLEIENNLYILKTICNI